MNTTEKYGLALMLVAISLSVGYPDSEVVVGIVRSTLFLIGFVLFVYAKNEKAK